MEGKNVKYITITIENGAINWESLQRIELIKIIQLLKGLLKQSRSHHPSIKDSLDRTERVLGKILVEEDVKKES